MTMTDWRPETGDRRLETGDWRLVTDGQPMTDDFGLARAISSCESFLQRGTWKLALHIS